MTRFAALNPFQTLFYSCNVSGVGPTSGFTALPGLSLASSLLYTLYHCKSFMISMTNPYVSSLHSAKPKRHSGRGPRQKLLYRLANELDPRKCVPLIMDPGLRGQAQGILTRLANNRPLSSLIIRFYAFQNVG